MQHNSLINLLFWFQGVSTDIEEDPQSQIFSKVHFDTIFDSESDISTLLEDIHENENGVVSANNSLLTINKLILLLSPLLIQVYLEY